MDLLGSINSLILWRTLLLLSHYGRARRHPRRQTFSVELCHFTAMAKFARITAVLLLIPLASGADLWLATTPQKPMPYAPEERQWHQAGRQYISCDRQLPRGEHSASSIPTRGHLAGPASSHTYTRERTRISTRSRAGFSCGARTSIAITQTCQSSRRAY